MMQGEGTLLGERSGVLGIPIALPLTNATGMAQAPWSDTRLWALGAFLWTCHVVPMRNLAFGIIWG